jgi:hypothetical protein
MIICILSSGDKSSHLIYFLNEKSACVTGTYILQPLGCQIYKEENSEICLSCGEEIETLEHLVLECSAWDCIINPTLEEIKTSIFFAYL